MQDCNQMPTRYFLIYNAYVLKMNLKAYQIFSLSPEIGNTASKLVFKYSTKYSLHIPDLLIAATAIQTRLSLFTDNKHHFDFIEELALYEP